MPTNTAPVATQDIQDTGKDATWGCSPGYICDPPKPDHCQFWANPPNANYTCHKDYCVKAPSTIDVHWPDDHTSWYPATEGYFNLNPEDFGLSFDIFEANVVTATIGGLPTTYTTGDWSSQASLSSFPPATTTPGLKIKARAISKRANTVPAVCYADCNNCFVEAQKVGKVYNLLCASGTPFEQDLNTCQTCVAAHGDTQKLSLQTYVQPQFAQFLDFCSVPPAQSEVAAPTTTSSNTETGVPLSVSPTSALLASGTTSTPTSVVQGTSQVSASSQSTAPISTSTPTPSVASQSSATSAGVSTSLPASTPGRSSSSPSSSPSTTSSPSSSPTSTGASPITTASSGNSLQPSGFLLLISATTLALCAFFVY